MEPTRGRGREPVAGGMLLPRRPALRGTRDSVLAREGGCGASLMGGPEQGVLIPEDAWDRGRSPAAGCVRPKGGRVEVGGGLTRPQWRWVVLRLDPVASGTRVRGNSTELFQYVAPGSASWSGFVRRDHWGPRGEGYEGTLCAVRGTRSEIPGRRPNPQIAPSRVCAVRFLNEHGERLPTTD